MGTVVSKHITALGILNIFKLYLSRNMGINFSIFLVAYLINNDSSHYLCFHHRCKKWTDSDDIEQTMESVKQTSYFLSFEIHTKRSCQETSATELRKNLL